MGRIKHEYFNNKYAEHLFSQWDQSKPMPDELALLAYAICTNMGKRPNFKGYTWCDDWASDGMYNILKYSHNFDPIKGSLFSYWSMIAFNSFVFGIKRYKKAYALRDAGIKLHNQNKDLYRGDDRAIVFNMSEVQAIAIDTAESDK